MQTESTPPTGLGGPHDLSSFSSSMSADHALTRSLGTPIDALRASIEALEKEFDEPDPRGLVLRGALDELRRLGRRVEELVDFATPVHPQPLRCTAEEIVRAVRGQLCAHDQERIVLARAADVSPIWVDGPVLTRALRRLVENALEASAEDVLLSVRQDATHTFFAVVDHSPSVHFDPLRAEAPFASEKPDQLGLGLTLAKRDVESMGGTLEGRRTQRFDTWFRVRIPFPVAAADAGSEEVAA